MYLENYSSDYDAILDGNVLSLFYLSNKNEHILHRPGFDPESWRRVEFVLPHMKQFKTAHNSSV